MICMFCKLHHTEKVLSSRLRLKKSCLPSYLSVFLLHNFFSTMKIEENRTCCIGMDGGMSLGKMDCKIKKLKN